MSTRAEQRRLRLLEIEKEQRLEDDEALKMTEEQRETLLRSFQSVKFEFYDLDGLSWTDSIRHELRQYTRSKPAFAVLSKADLASFSSEDTIRVSAIRSCGSEPELESPQQNANYLTLQCGKRDGTRTRSPIKGLFSILDNNTTSDNRSARKLSIDAGDQRTLRLKDPPVSAQSPGGSPKSPTTDAGIITCIFRSPILPSSHGRMISQTCSVASTPKSSPSLMPIAHFASP